MDTETPQQHSLIVHRVDGLNQQGERFPFHRVLLRGTLTLVMSSRRPMARAAAEGELRETHSLPRLFVSEWGIRGAHCM